MPNHTQLSVKYGQLALYTFILTLYCIEKVIFICPPSSSIIILLFSPFIPPCWCTRLWRRVKTRGKSQRIIHLGTLLLKLLTHSWSCARQQGTARVEEWSDTTDVEVLIRKSAAVRERTNGPLSRDKFRISTNILRLGDFCAHFSPLTTWQYCWDTLRC